MNGLLSKKKTKKKPYFNVEKFSLISVLHLIFFLSSLLDSEPLYFSGRHHCVNYVNLVFASWTNKKIENLKKLPFSLPALDLCNHRVHASRSGPSYKNESHPHLEHEYGTREWPSFIKSSRETAFVFVYYRLPTTRITVRVHFQSDYFLPLIFCRRFCLFVYCAFSKKMKTFLVLALYFTAVFAAPPTGEYIFQNKVN